MLIVVKYGGNAMDGGGAGDPVLRELAERVREGDRVVVIHGGGPQIDAALRMRGISTERIAGQRVTSAETLEVTEAVLCGTVNKAIVRALLGLGISAVGISGQDGGLLRAVRLDPALGYVGRIVAVDRGSIDALLQGGYLPVVAPLAFDAAAATALNVNADTAAGALAGALGADAYLNVTNVERVRLEAADPASGVRSLTSGQVRDGVATGAFGGGMLPKVQSALSALEGGAKRAFVIGAGRGAISAAFEGGGTEILA